ncbi:type I secretion system permease/ATPase [Hyphomonas jannaschiana]|uniref:Type I secretion system ATPase n=1 Tax=Hyphomonas jannaschiana VP2 TaxID=1280952 RepID=A0A059FFC2_9PROT|nr:type I secretion system permease/ATPase [Hyphomonas jannaschiana]KCZ89241.1 type I secretion system ATPase [Hyphomonas jannaschiana VP2]
MTARHTPNEMIEALTASKGVVFHLLAFSLALNLLMLTGPLYMLQVYDRVIPSQSMPTLVALSVLILMLYATLGILEWVRTGLFSSAASRFEDRLSERVANASMDLALKEAGQLSDKPLRDLRQLRRFFSGPVPGAVMDAPWSPLFFIVLFMLHPIFGLWAVFGAIVLVGIGFLNQRLTDKHLRETEIMERTAQAHSQEMVRNAEVIDAMGMRPNLRSRWRQSFDASDNRMFQSGRQLSGFTAGTKAFRLFLQSAILGIGAWLVIRGTNGMTTAGELVAASILMGRAIAPIEQSVAQWRSIISAHESWTALKAILEKVPPRGDAMELPPIQGHLSVENLYGGPPGSRKPVIRNLSFQLQPGDVLGILGPSAAGKSTLARLMTGVWPLISGTVRLDGAELGHYSREQLGRQIGYLPQQSDLMSGTIRENIARFDPQAEPAAIISAAQAAACHDLILRLPDGYDTEVGMAGAFLSAGQRQRVGLARALYGDPSFVVLDEPNSNLDAKGDEALQLAIRKLQERRATTIIVAHRPNAIANCNKLLVIEDGEMKAFGPRDDVLSKILPKPSGVPSIRKRTESNG